ncbi:MAG: hypothetical protein N2117_07975 [Anaerolineales bacterium]|nr:hypothetical protein [Anaerolineales bacterium]MCX7755170.1 hypothetical protein [Anaerolineales bacterium]MDW8277836.1 hypothetical protein [Anaerolineales bacterium]
MKNHCFLLICFLLVLLLACGPISSLPTALPAVPTASPSPGAPPPAETPVPAPTPVQEFGIRTHPDGPLYVGDQVSFEVVPPQGFDVREKSVEIQVAGQSLGVQPFAPFGIGGRTQATFFWAWNTAGLEAGPHTLTLTLHPDGVSWQETFTLRPAAEVPSPEPDARWESLSSDCCIIYYITGTDAHRDIEILAEMADAEALRVEARLGASFGEKIPLTFLPRVLGHGGFAWNGLYVSYLDENYAGHATRQVIHHEMVHWLDARQGGELRPSILVEGLAVYLSGGHYKEEPILPRAAALLELGWYIPLRDLTDAFYTSQHEIGYLQAAALVAYLVETYGWERFNAFYRDIHPVPEGTQSAALETALQKHFGRNLDSLEADFLAFLRAQPVDDSHRTDLRLTVAFYDTLREYQQQYDPSAYFLSAWLPDISEMRRRGIVADLLRRPREAVNVQIEALLIQADRALRSGEYVRAESFLHQTMRWFAE